MSSTAQDQQLAPPSQVPQLNGLEEDDEFEEFATEGMHHSMHTGSLAELVDIGCNCANKCCPVMGDTLVKCYGRYDITRDPVSSTGTRLIGFGPEYFTND